MKTTLLKAGTANASGDALRIAPGKSIAFFYGTWDTSTLTLEYSIDGGTTWIAVVAGKTANGTYEFTAMSDLKYRATLSSVGAGTTVSLEVVANAYPFNI